jgi:hypothetical protein
LDLQLPDAPGDQVYQTAKQIDPDLNVIVITGQRDPRSDSSNLPGHGSEEVTED